METPFRKLSPLEENELRMQTTEMYKVGGFENVLSAVHMMMQCQRVIMEKLAEILEEERGSRKS